MSAVDPRAEAELLAGLRAIVGDRGLLTGEDVRSRSCDPFRNVPPLGPAIVRPASTGELAEVMRFCHARGQRVVTHGGRTSVAGGAYVGADEIAVSLERMTAIEEIDPVGQLAVVQAGMTLEGLQNAVAEQGLFYPVDLGAKGTATIGGTIATNAGGNRVLRWGMTRQNLLGLEAVLADGTVVSSMNRLVKNNTGYDLKHLFIGTEGTMGIVTRAVLRLVPVPVSQSVAFVSVPDYQAVLGLLARARRLATLSAFEVMWRDYYALVAESGTDRRPVAPDQPYYVLIEAMGYNEEIDTQLFNAFLEDAYEKGLIADAVTAASGKQIEDLWRVREGSEIIVREMSPFVSFDISVDVARAEAFVEKAREALDRRYSFVRSIAFGHLGDNNIHIGVHVGPETMAEEIEIERCVYDVVKDFGGALTAEHGIGRFKREFLPEHKTAGEMEAMRRMRAAFDPDGLLNRDLLF
jgi:FAD/FMN-containing dehydrogenase